MLKTIDGVRLVRFEPQAHVACLVQWYYSPAYAEFFRELPTCPDIETLVRMSLGKTFMVVKDGQIIGAVMYYDVNETSRRAELSVLIDEQFQRRKQMVGAVKILLYWLFNNLNLYKVTVKVMSRNTRLNEILKVGGFSHEGTLRNHVYLDGDFHNVNCWALFKGEFNKRYKREFEKDLEHGTGSTRSSAPVPGPTVWPTKPTSFDRGNGELSRIEPGSYGNVGQFPGHGEPGQVGGAS